MRVAILALLTLAASLPTSVQEAAAQEAPADSVRVLTEIELRDGSRFIGTVISEGDDGLVLMTLSGSEVRIQTAQIASRRTVTGRVRDGEFRPFDPNETRLFFAPTGRSLPRGQGYLAAYYVVFGFVAYGVTDEFSLAGGTFLAPSIAGDLLYVAPRYRVFQQGSSNASVGALVGIADGNAAGVMYGTWTKGQPDRAFTLGVGVGFSQDEVAPDPVIVLGIERSMSRRTKFIAEAYAVPTLDASAVFIGGVRFMADRLAADLGLLGIVGEGDDIPALPWVSFAYNFGK